ncbi:MAG: MFS transporter [Deltaproteobacteria bacterium]|nr:MAG: MFS transporter [Deltaproteobacteria bacterium]
MVGLERSVLPLAAEVEFGLAARTAILSFVAAFGLSKALSNYAAGRLGDRWGRRPVLILGWAIAVPVAPLLMWAPTWGWIVGANVLLGASQGLAWSTTVIMKIDLAGPRRRGLAMGINEFAGYVAVAGSALAAGYVATRYGLRPAPFALGLAYVAAGGVLSVFAIRETRGHAAHEALRPVAPPPDVFVRTSFRDPTLSSVCQAGLVNNANDAMAWGLFPLMFAAAGLAVDRIGWLAALYPLVWGAGQIPAGAISDRFGRKWPIVVGMTVQGVAIVMVAAAASFTAYAVSTVLLGVGTALVYPTLLAAVGDAADPSWRASAVGVYRLWRDLGYVAGAVVAGVVADTLGPTAATVGLGVATVASGLVVAVRMPTGAADPS